MPERRLSVLLRKTSTKTGLPFAITIEVPNYGSAYVADWQVETNGVGVPEIVVSRENAGC